MSSQATRSRALPHRRQKTGYKSPSTLKHSQERLDKYILKMDNLQPVEDKPQQPKTQSQPSKPMTLQDLKIYMSSASKAMEEERKNELENSRDKRKKEREEEIEKLKVMLGLPP